MKRQTFLSIVVLLSMVLVPLAMPLAAQELDTGAEPLRAPRPAPLVTPAPAAPAPDWGGTWQYGADTDFVFTRFDAEFYPGDGLVYFMGGRVTTTPDTDGSVWSFDPATGAYADTGVDIVTPISNYTMNLLQDATGWGFYTFCGRPTGGLVTDAVQVYYPDTNTVVQLPSADDYPGTGTCTSGLNVVYDNKVFVAGGFDPDFTPANFSETWVFDPLAPSGSRWTQIPSANLNLARAYIMSAVVDDLIYAIGGNWYDGAALVNTVMVEVMDPNAATPTWDDAAAADLPEECSSSRAYGFDSSSPYLDPDGTPLGGKVVSGCGFWADENEHVYVYNTTLDYWEAFPYLQTDRRDHAAAFVPSLAGRDDGMPGLWVWGGRKDSDTNILVSSEYYDLETLSCNVLLVDDDWDFDTTVPNDGGRPYYTSTLDALGAPYDVWDTISMGHPFAADMAPYDAVVWFTGYDWETPITPTEEAELISYLDAGGNLLMSSQEQAYAFGISPIMSSYFWVDSVTEDVVITDTVGNAADPLFAGLGPYTLVRPDLWAAYWPTDSYQGPYDDEAYVKAGGFEPMNYFTGGNPNSTRFEGAGFKTIYLGWPLEWLGDADDRQEFLGTALNWLCASGGGAMDLIPPGQTGHGVPGADVDYGLELSNNLGAEETFDLTYASGWTISGPPTLTVPNGGSLAFTVTVTIDPDANCYQVDTAVVTATAQVYGNEDTAYLETTADPFGVGNVMGTIYDANTGDGINQAYVYLELGDDYFETWTAADGSYAFYDLDACTFLGDFAAVGYQPQSGVPVPVDPGMTTTFDLDLEAAFPVLGGSLYAIVPTDTVQTISWTLRNHGGADLHFHLSDLPMDAGYILGQQSLPMPTGVDPQVYADLDASADGTARFIAYLANQADLSAAFNIKDWAARGQYVFDALQQAAKSQEPLKADLDALNIAYEPRYIVNALVVSGDRSLVNALANRPDVAFIGPDNEVDAPEPVDMNPNVDAGIDVPVWNLTQIGTEDVWNQLGVFGDGVVVSNIDTGVLYTHDALVDNYRGTTGPGTYDHNYNWWDPYGDQPLAPYDYHSHGSHTIGTMAGTDYMGTEIGIAPNAQWIACNGFKQGGSGYGAELLECAEFLLAPWDLTGANPDPDLRPHIINNSWGGGQAQWWYNQAIYAWRAAGILGVFSAGNSGPGCGTMGDPGDMPMIMAVGATDNADLIAGFSSRGPAKVSGLMKPEVSAPGVNVISAYNDGTIGTMSGTSMAAPHVSGLAALIWSAQPELIGDVDLTYWVLEQTALGIADAQCGDAGPPNNVYGWGRIQAYEAVSMALTVDWTTDWLSIDPLGGVVAPGGSVDIGFTYDTNGLTFGNCYNTTIQLDLNDPYITQKMLPVNLCVGQGYLYLPVAFRNG